MKKYILILLTFICLVSCSNGQNKKDVDYSTEIMGCWRMVDMYYEVKSNYPEIDSLVLKDAQEFIERVKSTSNTTKFFEDLVIDFDENGKPSKNPAVYFLKEDSLYTRGTFRQDESSARITIKNDTLYLEMDSYREFKKVLRKQKKNREIPKDIKLEKMIRHAIAVRVGDCDQYQE